MGGYAWSTWKLILRLESLTWILFFGGPELLSALCSLPSALCSLPSALCSLLLGGQGSLGAHSRD